MRTVRSIAENIAESIAFTSIGEMNGQNSEVHVRRQSRCQQCVPFADKTGTTLLYYKYGNIGPNYIVPILAGSRDRHFANPECRD